MKPYYTDRFCQIFHGDCLEVLAGMDEASFTACVTDPPYGLEFMGKEWDHGVPGVEFWRAVLRVLKPGGILLAFGGTRTYHRMACAVEDAGFEVRDCLMWMYGSGFPKSYNVSKGIDRAKGAKREKIGEREWVQGGGNSLELRRGEARTVVQDITTPATPEAALWTGYGSALKPAWEPIILAMKPLEGGYARNALAHGVAELNVDGGRIDCADHPGVHKSMSNNLHEGYRRPWRDGGAPQYKETPSGRWPANVLLSHDPRCVRVGERRVKSQNPQYRSETDADTRAVKNSPGPKKNRANKGIGYADADGCETVEAWDCVPGCPVRILDEQSGVSSHKAHIVHVRSRGTGRAKGHEKPHTTFVHGDTGTASRFFYCAKASTHERNEGQSKPNRHPTVKPMALITYLLKLVTMPEGTRILDPFMGSGTTLRAAKELGIKAVGIDMEEEYCASSAERLSQEVLW